MGIQEYSWPQQSVLIDTHEGYVLIDRKLVCECKKKHRKKAKLRHLKFYYYLSDLFFS